MCPLQSPDLNLLFIMIQRTGLSKHYTDTLTWNHFVLNARLLAREQVSSYQTSRCSSKTKSSKEDWSRVNQNMW